MACLGKSDFEVIENLEWCEENDLNLNAKAKKKLLDIKLWLKHQHLVDTANTLMANIGREENNNFNLFKSRVEIA